MAAFNGWRKGDNYVNRRTCPSCGGRSYSSYSGPNWDCPYCGMNLDHVPNELSDTPEDSQGEEMGPIEVYTLNAGKSEKYVDVIS